MKNFSQKKHLEEGTCPHYRSKKISLMKKVIDHYNEENKKKARIDL